MRHENAQKRIKRAVAHILETQGQLPRNVKDRIRLIQQTTKKLFKIVVSESTLRRRENMDYWHPKYRFIEKKPEEDQ